MKNIIFQIKCDIYWPEEGTETYGIIEVTLVNTISLTYYIKKICTIRCKVNEKVYENCFSVTLININNDKKQFENVYDI